MAQAKRKLLRNMLDRAARRSPPRSTFSAPPRVSTSGECAFFKH
jgi:hypothetical protein